MLQFLWKSKKKKKFTHFLRYFWLVKENINMKIKRIEKAGSFFEFSTSKLGCMEIFMKICAKKYWPIFWKIEAKMKIKILKIGKMSSIFDFLISKLDYVEFFMKIWEKSFFVKFLPKKIYKNRERILSSFKKRLCGIN